MTSDFQVGWQVGQAESDQCTQVLRQVKNAGKKSEVISECTINLSDEGIFYPYRRVTETLPFTEIIALFLQINKQKDLTNMTANCHQTNRSYCFCKSQSFGLIEERIRRSHEKNPVLYLNKRLLLVQIYNGERNYELAFFV